MYRGFRARRSLSPPPSPDRQNHDVDNGATNHAEEAQEHERIEGGILSTSEACANAIDYADNEPEDEADEANNYPLEYIVKFFLTSPCLTTP